MVEIGHVLSPAWAFDARRVQNQRALVMFEIAEDGGSFSFFGLPRAAPDCDRGAIAKTSVLKNDGACGAEKSVGRTVRADSALCLKDRAGAVARDAP